MLAPLVAELLGLHNVTSYYKQLPRLQIGPTCAYPGTSWVEELLLGGLVNVEARGWQMKQEVGLG